MHSNHTTTLLEVNKTEGDMSKTTKIVSVGDRTPVPGSFLYLMPPALQQIAK